MPARDSHADQIAALSLELHGHEVIYRTAGSGPLLLVIHGMVKSSKHWRVAALRVRSRHLRAA